MPQEANQVKCTLMLRGRRLINPNSNTQHMPPRNKTLCLSICLSRPLICLRVILEVMPSQPKRSQCLCSQFQVSSNNNRLSISRLSKVSRLSSHLYQELQVQLRVGVGPLKNLRMLRLWLITTRAPPRDMKSFHRCTNRVPIRFALYLCEIASTLTAPARPLCMNVHMLVQFPIVTEDFHDLMN